jgi:hypothetical protein
VISGYRISGFWRSQSLIPEETKWAKSRDSESPASRHFGSRRWSIRWHRVASRDSARPRYTETRSTLTRSIGSRNPRVKFPVAEFAKPREPILRQIRKGGSPEVTVGKELLGELEERRLFGPRLREGPGRATVPVRAGCVKIC